MIAQEDRDTIVRLAREYHVSRVILFGSSVAVNLNQSSSLWPTTLPVTVTAVGGEVAATFPRFTAPAQLFPTAVTS